MRKPIEDLLLFMNTGEVSSVVKTAVDELGAKNVRVILIELFSWLKRQHRFKHQKCLEINPEFTWCQELPRFLKLVDLGSIFTIDEMRFSFNESLVDADRTEIRVRVANSFHSVLRTHAIIDTIAE